MQLHISRKCPRDKTENFYTYVLNEDGTQELKLYECVKCLMMMKAVDYYRKYKVLATGEVAFWWEMTYGSVFRLM